MKSSRESFHVSQIADAIRIVPDLQTPLQDADHRDDSEGPFRAIELPRIPTELIERALRVAADPGGCAVDPGQASRDVQSLRAGQAGRERQVDFRHVEARRFLVRGVPQLLQGQHGLPHRHDEEVINAS